MIWALHAFRAVCISLVNLAFYYRATAVNTGWAEMRFSLPWKAGWMRTSIILENSLPEQILT